MAKNENRGCYWFCDISCSCQPVPEDEKFNIVKEFVKKHNISNETFMKYLMSYQRKHIYQFNKEYGEMSNEIDAIINMYRFRFPKKTSVV